VKQAFGRITITAASVENNALPAISVCLDLAVKIQRKEEELITRLTEEFSKSNQSGKFEDARYYLMRIKDTYIELGQNDKASETSAKN